MYIIGLTAKTPEPYVDGYGKVVYKDEKYTIFQIWRAVDASYLIGRMRSGLACGSIQPYLTLEEAKASLPNLF